MDNLLPELSSDDIIVKIKEDNFKQFLRDCQSFALYINKDVNVKKLENHPTVKGVQYLPISYMQSMLDTLFFGLWKETNFRWQIVSNEITGAIDLSVYHPYLKDWLTRTGGAAIKIMTDAIPEKMKEKMSKPEINAWALDLQNKKPGALSNGGFASLKADCFKNACLTLGKLFGRDVNRKLTEDITPLISKDVNIKPIRDELSKLLSKIKDDKKREELIKYITEVEEKGNNTLEFYNGIIKTI